MLAGRVHGDRHLDDGVDMELAHEFSDYGLAGVGVDEVHLLDRAHRVGYVAAEQRRHLGGEPARDLRSERVGHAGDEDAPGKATY